MFLYSATPIVSVFQSVSRGQNGSQNEVETRFTTTIKMH